MRRVACPVGFTDQDLPPGAELPAAWRAPPATAAMPAPAPTLAAGGATGDGRALGHQVTLQVELSTRAHALYSAPAVQAAARGEEESANRLSQLEGLCYVLLALGFVVVAPHLPSSGLLAATAAGAAIAVGAHECFGRGPNLRRGQRHLAAGRHLAAERAIAWNPGRGAGLLQLAESRRRRRDWRGAATALVRLHPQTPAMAADWARQFEAVAARYPGELATLVLSSDEDSGDEQGPRPASPSVHATDLGHGFDDDARCGRLPGGRASQRRTASDERRVRFGGTALIP